MARLVASVAAAFCSLVLALVPKVAHSAPASKTPTVNHAGQFGLRMGVALPFKVNFRYDDSPPCDVTTVGEQKKVCPVSSPVALDFAISYAVTSTVEPFLWYRQGLSAEEATNTKATTLLGAGLRIYTNGTAPFKILLQPAVAAEIEGPILASFGRNYGTDFVAQLHFGGQYDFSRHVGAYFSLGPNVSFVRALSLGLDGTFGVQGRLP